MTTTYQRPDFPAWLEEITPYDIAAILQGGCDSGAYMPAVTYHSAVETMSNHGDEVLQYIEDVVETLPSVDGLSWSGMACKYVSAAVELWCSAHEHLADWERDEWNKSE